MRVARGDEPSRGQEHEREGAPHLRRALDDRVLEALPATARVEVEDDLGVGGRLEDRARRLQLVAQLGGVHEVAVVADRDRAAVAVDEDTAARSTSGCRPRSSSGRGRSAGRPGSARELGLGEDVVHEAHRPVGDRAARRRTAAMPGALLAAVLQRVEAEVGEVRGLGVAEDAEDAAFVVELVEHAVEGSRSDLLSDPLIGRNR